MEALRIEGLSKNFGALQVLENVSFSVEKAECRVVIIGPNGAGKTTLFNLISGELSPTAGKITLFSKDVTNMPNYRRVRLGLGRTFQIPDLFFNLTLFENVRLAVMADKRARFALYRPVGAFGELREGVKRLLDYVGLWEKREDQVSSLSHGEVRRLEIILGMASSPGLLLLDEPTAGLSSSEAEQLATQLRSLLGEIAVIIIEHDMKVAFALADRITVLNQGRILVEGTPADIKADPRVRAVYLGVEG